MRIRDVVSAFGRPVSWCFGLFFLASELSLFGITDVLQRRQMYSAESSSFYHLVALAVCLVLFLASMRRPVSFWRNRWATLFEVILCVLGIVLLAASRDGGQAGAFFVVGCLCVALGANLMQVQVQEIIVTLEPARLKQALFAGALVDAVCLAFYHLIFTALYPVVAALFVASGVLLVAADLGESPAATAAAADGRRGPSPAPVLLGVAAIVVSWAFLQSQIYGTDAVIVNALVVVTKLAALGVFVYLLFAVHDLSFASAGKFVCVMISWAMVLSLAGASPYVASATMNTGYSFFELAIYVAVAEVVSRTRACPVHVLSSVWLVVHGAYVVGSGLGIGSSAGILAGPFVEAALLMALIVVSLCLFDEKHTTAFLLGVGAWEIVAGSPGADAAADVAPREGRLFEACGLTDREREVAALYVKGRSAVFIAEDLGISPHTVRSHIARIYEKCQVHSRQELLSLLEGRAAARPPES